MLVGLVACTGAHSSPQQPAAGTTSAARPPVMVTWSPMPAVPGATSLTWVTSAGEQVLVSGQRGTGDAAPPGLWRDDGHGWDDIDLAPVTYYGRRAQLYRVVSDGRRVVALGRRIGGTHGNPRVTSWTGTLAGVHETEQPFELFGGPDAIAVTDLALGPSGGVVLGAWAHHGDPAGAAVWLEQGDTWRRYDEAPGLASEVTDVGSELTMPEALAVRAGAPVIVGWTVHLAAGQLAFRASMWRQEGPGWQEVRLPAVGDAQARAVTCGPGECTVVGSASGSLAVWVVRGSAVRAVPVPAIPVADRGQVSAATTRAGVWLSVAGEGATQVLRSDRDRFVEVSPPPGAVTSMTAVDDAVIALVRSSDGSTRLWTTASG
jgi:hypothetical protein